MALSTYHNIDNTIFGPDNLTDYQRYRFKFILSVEERKELPYRDTNKNLNPTIGIGFNLTDHSILELVLQQFGVTNPAAVNGFSNILGTSYSSDIALQTALNTGIHSRAKESKS